MEETNSAFIVHEKNWIKHVLQRTIRVRARAYKLNEKMCDEEVDKIRNKALLLQMVQMEMEKLLHF